MSGPADTSPGRERRLVWVIWAFPIPEQPPGMARPNDPYEAKWWPGLNLASRWNDKKYPEWTALFSCQRPNGRQNFHGCPGILLKERLTDELSKANGARTQSPCLALYLSTIDSHGTSREREHPST